MTTKPFPFVSCWRYFSEAFRKHLQTLPVFFFFFKAAIKVLYCTLKPSEPRQLDGFHHAGPISWRSKAVLSFSLSSPIHYICYSNAFIHQNTSSCKLFQSSFHTCAYTCTLAQVCTCTHTCTLTHTNMHMWEKCCNFSNNHLHWMEKRSSG